MLVLKVTFNDDMALVYAPTATIDSGDSSSTWSRILVPDNAIVFCPRLVAKLGLRFDPTDPWTYREENSEIAIGLGAVARKGSRAPSALLNIDPIVGCRESRGSGGLACLGIVSDFAKSFPDAVRTSLTSSCCRVGHNLGPCAGRLSLRELRTQPVSCWKR